MKGGDIFFTTPFCRIMKLLFVILLIAFLVLMFQYYSTMEETDMAHTFRVYVLPFGVVLTFFVGFSSSLGICRLDEVIPYYEDDFGKWFNRHNGFLKHQQYPLLEEGGKRKRHSTKRS